VIVAKLIKHIVRPFATTRRLSHNMSWQCSGRTNLELINNMFREGLITQERVRKAFLDVDRAHFSPTAPYADAPQSIGHAATISAPHMHASACEHLLPSLTPGAKVLDVGSGSGYLSAILAHLVAPGGSVVGIEHIQDLVDLSTFNMNKSDDGKDMLKNERVKFVCGDGRKGYKEGAPYDVIHVGAAAAHWHEDLTAQLREGGRMFIPVGDYEQHVWLVEKDKGGEVTKRKLFGVRYVPLTDAP